MTSLSVATIPFNQPFVPDAWGRYMAKALNSRIQQGDGPFSKTAEHRISEIYGGIACILVPSCTAALELSLMLLDVGPGDEVIMPSFNFTSAATAITKFWATPVICDIKFESGCIDVEQVEKSITSRTKAISWVNYGGNGPNFQELVNLSQAYKIPLVEDAAHNFGLMAGNQKGVSGDFVCVSFHATKNIQCGEGGAIIIKNQDYLDRAYVMREKGTNRKSYSQGLVPKYNWIDRGSSYLLSEVSSALLTAQLDEFARIQQSRKHLSIEYAENLQNVSEFGWTLFSNNSEIAHLFALIAPNRETRESFIRLMMERGIETTSHYQDLASSAAGMRYGFAINTCPNSEDLSARIVRLPLFPNLGKGISRVIEGAIETIKELEVQKNK